MQISKFSHETQNIKVAVDIILYKMQKNCLSVLLVRRKYPPFLGDWALPGGFVGPHESLLEAAIRELNEETGLKEIYFEQLYSFGDAKRDPRGYVVSIAYLGLVRADADIEVRAGSDALEADWFDVENLPKLAFDHAQMLVYSRERLANKLEYTTAGFSLLPELFTLSDLQSVYEKVLKKKLDKRNFRRKLALLDILVPTDEFRSDGIQRPAQLFKLSTKKFDKLKNKGIIFPF